MLKKVFVKLWRFALEVVDTAFYIGHPVVEFMNLPDSLLVLTLEVSQLLLELPVVLLICLVAQRFFDPPYSFFDLFQMRLRLRFVH